MRTPGQRQHRRLASSVLTVTIVAAVVVVAVPTASADDHDQPADPWPSGHTVFEVTDSSFLVRDGVGPEGDNAHFFDTATLQGAVVAGNVSPAGAITIPKAVRSSAADAAELGGVWFPPRIVTDPHISTGYWTVRTLPAPTTSPGTPFTGMLDRTTGAVTLNLNLRFKLEGGAALVDDFGADCYVPNGANGAALALTTGTTSPPGPNQPATGAPLDPESGALHLVANGFTVAGAGGAGGTFFQGCGTLGGWNGLVNSRFGLPANGSSAVNGASLGLRVATPPDDPGDPGGGDPGGGEPGPGGPAGVELDAINVFEVRGGSMVINGTELPLAGDGPTDASIAAHVAADGTVTVPKQLRSSAAEAQSLGGVFFPKVEIPVDGYSTPTVSVQLQPAPTSNPAAPWTGHLDLATGAMTLPLNLRSKIEGGVGTDALGDQCYLPGFSSAGMALALTTGTTSPPPPNAPTTGVPFDGATGAVTLVDNAFAIAGANSCAIAGFGNQVIDDLYGLPAPAGTNAITLELALTGERAPAIELMAFDVTGGSFLVRDGAGPFGDNAHFLDHVEGGVIAALVHPDGTMHIPKQTRASALDARRHGGIWFPTATVPDELISSQEWRVRLQPAPTLDVETPWTGTYDRETGAVSIGINLRVQLVGGTDTDYMGHECFVAGGRFGIPLALTSGVTVPAGPSPALAGSPYDPDTGELRLVASGFSVGSANATDPGFGTGCASFGGANAPVNQRFGLPAPAWSASNTATFELVHDREAPPEPTRGDGEARYDRQGPWGDTVVEEHEDLTVVRPAALGEDADAAAAAGTHAGGYQHPILGFAVGSWGHPSYYQYLLEYFASWGYVVVAPNLEHTGSGADTWAAIEWALAQHDDPDSVFFGHLDPTRIATGGHSQGAGGALNASLLSGGRVSSTFVLAIPDQIWWNNPLLGLLAVLIGLTSPPTDSPVPDLGAVEHPTFFLKGTHDSLIASEPAHVQYFQAAGGPAFKASIVGGGHIFDEVPEVPYHAYLGAWLDYTLLDDPHGCRLFNAADGHGPELADHPLLTEIDAKDLPECAALPAGGPDPGGPDPGGPDPGGLGSGGQPGPGAPGDGSPSAPGTDPGAGPASPPGGSGPVRAGEPSGGAAPGADPDDEPEATHSGTRVGGDPTDDDPEATDDRAMAASDGSPTRAMGWPAVLVGLLGLAAAAAAVAVAIVAARRRGARGLS